MGKESLTEGLSSLLHDKSDKPKRGRPATSAREIIKTSQEGAKENETRATFIVKVEHLEKLKAMAYRENIPLKTVINKALEEYINKTNVQSGREAAKRKGQGPGAKPGKVENKKPTGADINILPTTIEGIRFFTIIETARTLHVTPQTIRAYIKQGKLKGQRIGRPILITESNLMKFLQSDTR